MSVFVISDNPLMFDCMFPFFFFQKKLPCIVAPPHLFGTVLQSYLWYVSQAIVFSKVSKQNVTYNLHCEVFFFLQSYVFVDWWRNPEQISLLLNSLKDWRLGTFSAHLPPQRVQMGEVIGSPIIGWWCKVWFGAIKLFPESVGFSQHSVSRNSIWVILRWNTLGRFCSVETHWVIWNEIHILMARGEKIKYKIFLSLFGPPPFPYWVLCICVNHAS